MSSLLKGGWHPGGEKKISRATWKSDLKGLAGRKDDISEHVKDHVATPLNNLKDPDSFGPPPKHTGYHGNAQSPTVTTPRASSPVISLEGPVPPPRERVKEQEQEVKPPSGPYQINTTGLRTDNLPKPPGRRDGTQTPVVASPATGRPVPSLPPRQTAGPPPVLPPRQSETPNERTPLPPPTYGEATKAPQGAGTLNTGALNRLGKAGVSVPGFGIGSSTSAASPSSPSNTGQLNELQQRFARMNNGSNSGEPQTLPVPSWKQAQALHSAAKANPALVQQAQSMAGGSSSPSTTGLRSAHALHSAVKANPALVQQAQSTYQKASASSSSASPTTDIQSAFNTVGQKKKPPPPPPAKKVELSSTGNGNTSSTAPPPIPTLTKPRFD